MPAHHITDIIIVLLAAIAVVPIFQRLKISPVLGYLAAGLVIGPFGISAIADPKEAEGLAEFGVIFLLFAIGLDLPLERLRAMRRYIFGLGALQVVVTGGVFAAIGMAFGLKPEIAAVVGGTLALSSTATVLQLLVERGEAAARFGRISVSVLLFQDLAVVPLLALIPLLAGGGTTSIGTALGLAGAKAIIALIAIVLAGRFVVRPLFDLIASTHNSELFTATALFILLGTGWITAEAGMSMALGAFLAGILLAGTPYRHQIEADIHPFRGLLLGLFFMTVGMTINVPAILAAAWTVVGLTIGLLAVKAVILAALVLAFGLPLAAAVRAGLLLSQGGEFAFVLFGVAGREGVLPADMVQALNAAVVLSICTTPALSALGARLAEFIRARSHSTGPRLKEEAHGLEQHVVVAGYGRVGQTICHLLEADKVSYIALDMDVQRVMRARELGRPVYFGDASRLDVLKATGIDRAGLAVVTLDNPAAAERAVLALRSLKQDLPILARARDRKHGRRLEAAGASEAVAEAIEASLILGSRVLGLAGKPADKVAAAVAAYRADDYARLDLELGMMDAAPAPAKAGGR